ncbi:MAG: hypothetical protein ACXVRJ_13005 [Gaiellaceae bacterium]
MTQRVRTWSSLGGLAFTVLAVVGAILLFDGPTDSSPAKMTAYYQRGSHRNSTHIGWLLTGLGVFFLVWFIGSVRDRIAAAERLDPGNESLLSTIAMIGGAAFVAVALAVIGTADGIKTMSDDTYQHTVYSGVIHGASDSGYMMLVSGGAAMAALIFAVSLAVFAFGILPRWVGWFGVLAGVAALLSLFFFTMLVWLLWLAVASIGLFRRASTA